MQPLPDKDSVAGRFGSLRRPTTEALSSALDGKAIDDGQARHLIDLGRNEMPALLAGAGVLRDRHKGRVVTYSPKAFFPVTNLCLDHCSYCTFRQDPGSPEARTMLPEDIRSVASRAASLGCIEALMCLGDKPERAFRSYPAGRPRRRSRGEGSGGARAGAARDRGLEPPRAKVA